MNHGRDDGLLRYRATRRLDWPNGPIACIETQNKEALRMSRLTLVSDVEVRVRAALQRSPMHAIRSLGVAHDGNSVRLTGVVETFYQKQLAQELVRPLTNPFQIVNEVEVAYA